MPRQIVFTSKAAKPPASYSQAVKAAGLVFVSGTAPHDPASGQIVGTTIQEQTRQCLTNIAAILDRLAAIAPVTAIRGNVDTDAWARPLPETTRVTIAAVAIYVLHDLNAIDLDPGQAGIRVVVSGHSHQPSIAERGGVLYVNPGSAGPRRFRLPITAAELLIDGGRVTARVRELVGPAPRA